jgi:hypothetical protein
MGRVFSLLASIHQHVMACSFSCNVSLINSKRSVIENQWPATILSKRERRCCIMDSYEEIALLAYELYERRGKTDGFDVDDWIEAERVISHQSYAEDYVDDVL